MDFRRTLFALAAIAAFGAGGFGVWYVLRPDYVKFLPPALASLRLGMSYDDFFAAWPNTKIVERRYSNGKTLVLTEQRFSSGSAGGMVRHYTYVARRVEPRVLVTWTFADDKFAKIDIDLEAFDLDTRTAEQIARALERRWGSRSDGAGGSRWITASACASVRFRESEKTWRGLSLSRRNADGSCETL